MSEPARITHHCHVMSSAPHRLLERGELLDGRGAREDAVAVRRPRLPEAGHGVASLEGEGEAVEAQGGEEPPAILGRRREDDDEDEDEEGEGGRRGRGRGLRARR